MILNTDVPGDWKNVIPDSLSAAPRTRPLHQPGNLHGLFTGRAATVVPFSQVLSIDFTEAKVTTGVTGHCRRRVKAGHRGGDVLWQACSSPTFATVATLRASVRVRAKVR